MQKDGLPIFIDKMLKFSLSFLCLCKIVETFLWKSIDFLYFLWYNMHIKVYKATLRSKTK